MNYFQRSPIAPLGYPSLLDYGIFKKYLRIPMPYLKGIFQFYPNTLQTVPLDLPNVIEACHNAYWRKIKDMPELTQEEKTLHVRYKIAGVSPLYITRNELPACAGPTLGLVGQLIDDPSGFSKMGRVLYFHSEFENNAMLAASSIIKSGIRQGVSCAMIPFTSYMEKTKDFGESQVYLAKYRTADLSALCLIGTEYVKAESGFTESTLMEFVRGRQVAGKSTILSSHLTPTEFSARYFSLDKLGATSLKFEDAGMSLTIGQLSKELEAIKHRKE